MNTYLPLGFLVARLILNQFDTTCRPLKWLDLICQTLFLALQAELIGQALANHLPWWLALALSTFAAGILEVQTRPQLADSWAHEVAWLFASTLVGATTVIALAAVGVEGLLVSLAVTAMCIALELELRHGSEQARPGDALAMQPLSQALRRR